MQDEPIRDNGQPDTIPDDPSRPSDPTWEELGQQLREAGLDWTDLSSWGLAPTPEDLDVTPMFLRGAALEGGRA